MTAVKTKKKKQLFRDDAIAPRDESQKQEEFTRNQFTICKEKLLNYCQKWRNIYAIAADLDITIPETHTNLNRLEKEGLMESRKDGEEWRITPDSWLSGDWLIEDKQSIEEIFWVRVSVGRKLISFEIGEDAEGLGKYAKDEIYHFEVSKRSLVSQIKKYNILPTEYAAAFINANLTPKLSLCISSGDRCLFVDDKFKILQFDEKEIEKILNVDAEIKIKEFFLLKENELNLKRGDRVLITYYQLGIFETLPNEWQFLRIKGLYAEITRGDGCGDNYQKQPLWRIKKCSDTSNSSEELAASPMPQENGLATKSEPPATSISTSQRSPSTDRTSPASQSLGTSETSSQNEASMTSSPADFLAPEPQTQEPESDSITRNRDSGEKDFALSAKSGQSTPLSSNLWELSTEALERSLADSDWQAILSSLKQSQQRDSERHISAQDYLSLPTLTANNATANSRPAGRSKCETKFVQLGLTPNGSKLSAPAMAMLMGYPSDWLEAIAPSEPSTQPASPGRKDGTKAESCSAKPAAPLKQGSHSAECATSKGSQAENILPTPNGEAVEVVGENFLPTSDEIALPRYEIQLSDGEKVERGLAGLLNHLVEGAPEIQLEVGAIAYIQKQFRGQLFEGKIARLFEKEYRDKVAPGDLILIGDRHCDAGKIYRVASTRNGFITSDEGLCFHPDMYEAIKVVGRKLKVSAGHPTLGDRIVEVENYKDGHIKIAGGGFVALSMVSVASRQSPVTSDATPANRTTPSETLRERLGNAHHAPQPIRGYQGLWNIDLAPYIPAQKKAPEKQFEIGGLINFKGEIIGILGISGDYLEILGPGGSTYQIHKSKAIPISDKIKCGGWGEFRYDADCMKWISIEPRDRALWGRDEYLILDWYGSEKLLIPYGCLPKNSDGSSPMEGQKSYKPFWVDEEELKIFPAKKKRGRKPGSRNKKPASGYLYPRKDCQNYIYEYWDNNLKKKRCLSVRRDLGARVKKAIKDGLSVGEIIKFIKGGGQLALF